MKKILVTIALFALMLVAATAQAGLMPEHEAYPMLEGRISLPLYEGHDLSKFRGFIELVPVNDPALGPYYKAMREIPKGSSAYVGWYLSPATHADRGRKAWIWIEDCEYKRSKSDQERGLPENVRIGAESDCTMGLRCWVDFWNYGSKAVWFGMNGLKSDKKVDPHMVVFQVTPITWKEWVGEGNEPSGLGALISGNSSTDSKIEPTSKVEPTSNDTPDPQSILAAMGGTTGPALKVTEPSTPEAICKEVKTEYVSTGKQFTVKALRPDGRPFAGCGVVSIECCTKGGSKTIERSLFNGSLIKNGQIVDKNFDGVFDIDCAPGVKFKVKAIGFEKISIVGSCIKLIGGSK